MSDSQPSTVNITIQSEFEFGFIYVLHILKTDIYKVGSTYNIAQRFRQHTLNNDNFRLVFAIPCFDFRKLELSAHQKFRKRRYTYKKAKEYYKLDKFQITHLLQFLYNESVIFNSKIYQFKESEPSQEIQEILDIAEISVPAPEAENEVSADDILLEQVTDMYLSGVQLSTSMIQSKLSVGYPRAYRLHTYFKESILPTLVKQQINPNITELPIR